MVILPSQNRDIVELDDCYDSDNSTNCSTSQDDQSLAKVNSFTLREVAENGGNIFPANSHINVENSSDVVIGSLTQFNGPVTIVQNGNSKKILGLNNTNFITDDEVASSSNLDQPLTSTSTAKPSPSSNPPSPSTAPYWTSKRRCLIIVGAIGIIVTIIALSTTLTLNNETSDQTELPLPTSNVEDTVTLPPLGDGKHLQITRGRWGGRPMLNFTKVLEHPTPFVIVSHTAGVWCKDFRTCSDAMQILQSLHVASESPDIGYNFLIGGDANIYVGRGWDVRNFHADHNIGISFIGNFVYDYLTPGMIEACQELLEEGVKMGKLAQNYTLIGHNQTWPTQSPGEHIVSVIKTWPNFRPGDYLYL